MRTKARRRMDKVTYQLEVATTMEMIRRKELIMIKKLREECQTARHHHHRQG